MDIAAAEQPKTVLVIAHVAETLVTIRGPLLLALKARGHTIHAAAPGLTADCRTGSKLRSWGVRLHDVHFQRGGLNPVADLRALAAAAALIRRIGPDAIFSYTIKPAIWGTMAGRLAGVPQRFVLIPGLGYSFTGGARGKRGAVRRIAHMLYRLALRHAHKVFFQNEDDAALFVRLKLLPQGVPHVVVDGSGVDLEHFAPAPLPPAGPNFLLIARLLGDKGIREYASAARRIRARHPETRFHLVGGLDVNPDAIPREEVEAWHADGTLVWHGATDDVRPAIAAANVYVLPSYREGTPRTVLEAMSMARAIITTDAPGCRETVIDGDNGFLVPVQSVDALVEAMQRFVANPELQAQMGHRSRQLAEERYDVHKVNAVMLREMGL